MNIVHAIILGVIEGLTEFFPISSTGHLIIAEKLFGITDPSLFFNVSIQCGAILAVVVYYWKSILLLFKQFVHGKRKTQFGLLLATVPVLIVGLLFHQLIEYLQQNILVVAATTFGVALFILWVQRTHAHTFFQDKKQEHITYLDYVIIGIFQAVAVIPGVSRSGITILGGLLRNLSFAQSMDIAFLLSIPAMGSATAFETLKLMLHPTAIQGPLILYTIVGGIAAFITSFATIAVTMPLFRKYAFTPFIVYRLILGVVLFLLFAL